MPTSRPEAPDKDDEYGIAQRITEMMALRRYSGRRLSTAAEIPYRTLRNYLVGKRPIPTPALRRVADVLEVSADWLLFGRPATFDQNCLAVAITALADMREAARKTGHEMSMLSSAQLLAELYEKNYRLRCIGIEVEIVQRDSGARDPRRK